MNDINLLLLPADASITYDLINTQPTLKNNLMSKI